jgi:pimeloyl-ACP methyl ester carboxylesterase
MTNRFIVPILFLLFYPTAKGQSQGTDVMVDVAGGRMHFHIVKGAGVPILFDAGGGDDASVWNDILKPLSDITGAPLITYDRLGFGQSEIDSADTSRKHGLLNGIEDLETGLKALGYDGDVILVSHSLGGFYSQFFASRHPDRVKAAVLIDSSYACMFTPDVNLDKMMDSMKAMVPDLENLKRTNPGRYYIYVNYPDTVHIMRKTTFPASIPVVDLVSEFTPYSDAEGKARWLACHKQFAAAAPNREGIVAYGSGHYIFQENPPLVVDSIVKIYSTVLSEPQRSQVLERGMAYAVAIANESYRRETAYRHTEDELNSLGYALEKRNDLQGALEVFKMNVELHSTSWNAHDSYGEALLKAGKKEEAIEEYRRSIGLNSRNTNAIKVLEDLLKPEPK